MKKYNISQGNWEINSQRNLVKCGQKWVADMTDGFEVVSAEEKEANALLIIEAGNTYQETGFSPKEMAEQNKELLKALQKVKLYTAINNGRATMVTSPEFMTEIDTVINNATKKNNL